MKAAELSGLTISIAEVSDAGGGTTFTVAPAVPGKRVLVNYIHVVEGSLDVSIVAEFGVGTMQFMNSSWLTLGGAALWPQGRIQIKGPIIGPLGLALRITATSSLGTHKGYYEVHWTYIS